MKILTILGTRPEIIRLSRLIPILDAKADHKVIHTGQNFDPNLSDIFFKDLDVRQPDFFLGARGETFSELIGSIISKSGEIFSNERPDAVLILGDTNSGLAAIPAKRMGIKVFHMEAGNRCFDDRVPEEVNRRIIDHTSDILLPYTSISQNHLLKEGISKERVIVTGNPIYQVLEHYKDSIDNSRILEELHLESNKYLLVTAHRSENVDDPQRLTSLMSSLSQVALELGLPMIVSLHPRTRSRLKDINVTLPQNLQLHEPFGLFDFVKLEKSARLVLTDSGTVQEECCIYMVPAVTMRESTERPETIECGSNVLSGIEPNDVLNKVHQMLEVKPSWIPPEEYIRPNVAEVVANLVVGNL